MARMTGADAHKARLARAHSTPMQLAVGQAIYAASDLLRVSAHKSIAAGAVQGKNHVPSAPGEPPNWDTGVLATGIVNYQTRAGLFSRTFLGAVPLAAVVESTAPYSEPLEFGTSTMEARPFMKPAADKTRGPALALVTKAVKQFLK